MTKKSECLEESEICAEAIIDIFHDRKGFRQEWDELDDELQSEIKAEIKEVIYDHIMSHLWTK